MTPSRSFSVPDWEGIRLVAFDVDGTLYQQRPLRSRIARDMLVHAFVKRDFNLVRVLSRYRRIRERLADEEAVDFEPKLIVETAKMTANSPEAVRAMVCEWIEQRPLRYLGACVYQGVPQLFAGLRRSEKSIGVLSDYPAREKLTALGLTADHVISAGDADIGLLKPQPRGLELLMVEAGVTAEETVLIGDRAERDGVAARRLGVRALIRSSKPIEGWQTFVRYDDALFAPFLGS